MEPETVRVLYSYESIEEDEISLAEGEVRQATLYRDDEYSVRL